MALVSVDHHHPLGGHRCEDDLATMFVGVAVGGGSGGNVIWKSLLWLSGGDVAILRECRWRSSWLSGDGELDYLSINLKRESLMECTNHVGF
jgi:hypothetical protein